MHGHATVTMLLHAMAYLAWPTMRYEASGGFINPLTAIYTHLMCMHMIDSERDVRSVCGLPTTKGRRPTEIEPWHGPYSMHGLSAERESLYCQLSTGTFAHRPTLYGLTRAH